MAIRLSLNIGCKRPSRALTLEVMDFVRSVNLDDAVTPATMRFLWNKRAQEWTLVVHTTTVLDSWAVTGRAHKFASYLGQECIALDTPYYRGLYGPRAQEWGPFDRELFII